MGDPICSMRLVLIVGVLSSWASVASGQTATLLAAPADLRLPNARLVRPLVHGHPDELVGVLTVDPQDHEVRFEADDGLAFKVFFSAIAGLDYEVARYPHRAFLRCSYYLTLRYRDDNGGMKRESVRLLTEAEGSSALVALEQATGLSAGRSQNALDSPPPYAYGLSVSPAASFGDLQTLVKQGETVSFQATKATGGYGPLITGTVLNLSGSTLRVLVAGQPLEFASQDVLALSVHRKSRGQGALLGLAVGGALGLASIARWCGQPVDRDSCGNAEGLAEITAGLGGLIGAMAGVNHERLVFRTAPEISSSKFTIRPMLGTTSTGVIASIRY